ncbi:hypothetical protein, partial [Legionella sp. 28fT52]|uniref:hypothetical protein n=1 Tax=Legionella sp. 28fT52 TaxID=3410134 RepID=UPI003AF96603
KYLDYATLHQGYYCDQYYSRERTDLSAFMRLLLEQWKIPGYSLRLAPKLPINQSVVSSLDAA